MTGRNQLDQEPAEGSRETIEHELERQPDQPGKAQTGTGNDNPAPEAPGSERSTERGER